MEAVHRFISYIGVPLTPSPVTLKVAPAGASCGSMTCLRAVVTYSSSKFGPPKATDVTCFAGIRISCSTFPLKDDGIFLGLTLIFFFGITLD